MCKGPGVGESVVESKTIRRVCVMYYRGARYSKTRLNLTGYVKDFCCYLQNNEKLLGILICGPNQIWSRKRITLAGVNNRSEEVRIGVGDHMLGYYRETEQGGTKR